MKASPDQLIQGFLDGTLSPTESEELNKLIKSDPAFANKLAETAVFHHALGTGFRSGTLPTRSGHPNTHAGYPDRKPLSTLIKQALPWALAAAAVIVTMMALISKPDTKNPPVVRETEKHNTGFAVLTRVVDPQWKGKTSPAQGDILGSGLLELKEGLVQIEFFSGVSLVVEGNAALEIISPDEMRLVRGKLRAHVPPPAIGFQIHTARGTVLDLGTEFALDFSNNKGELHVIDGEVEWHAKAAPEIHLTQGSALRFSGADTQQIKADPKRFNGPVELDAKVILNQDRQFLSWQQSSRNLKRQANILAYFPMEEGSPWTRSLSAFPKTIAPGAIVAAKAVDGRWPAKQALDFSPNGSRVRVNIPGQHQALTLSTWAKIDSLDRQFNALFLTDNYDLGEPHWQLTEQGQLFFSIGLGKEKFHHIFLSPVVWDHSDSEKWLHLVTTYDVATRTCSHYLNGRIIFQQQAPSEKGVDALKIGSAQIGNWGLPTREEPDFAVRNLNGRLDEFTLFKTVLTPGEIQSLYQAGKP